MTIHKLVQSSLERIGSKRLGAVILAAFLLTVHSMLAQQSEHWVGTWATADVGRPQNPPPPALPAAPPPGPAQQGQTVPPSPAPFMHFNNQTLRQIVHTSIGGRRVPVALSNAFGASPLTVGGAHIALRDKDSAIVPGSDRALTFSGHLTMAIPAGAELFSDPVNLVAPPMADLAIDLSLPNNTNVPSPLTMHGTALQTNYVSETGNHAGKTAFPSVATTQNWFLLSRIEVTAPESVSAIVAFGDSTTDGARSTPDTNNRWPNHLARRLLACQHRWRYSMAGSVVIAC